MVNKGIRDEFIEYNTSEVMLALGRYLYVVFMCQQAVEKINKGLYVFYNKEEPPRTHNIFSIFEKIQFKALNSDPVISDEYKDFFEELRLNFIFLKGTLLTKKNYLPALMKATPKEF